MPTLSPIDKLRTRVRRQRGRYRELSRRARLSYSWISQFASGARGKRPAFETLDSLGAALDFMESEQRAPRKVRPAGKGGVGKR